MRARSQRKHIHFNNETPKTKYKLFSFFLLVNSLSFRREDGKPIEYGNWQSNKKIGFEYRKFGSIQTNCALCRCIDSICLHYGCIRHLGVIHTHTNCSIIVFFCPILIFGTWNITPLATAIDGESITINRVSRLHMGAYLCIAQNGNSNTRRLFLGWTKINSSFFVSFSRCLL